MFKKLRTMDKIAWFVIGLIAGTVILLTVFAINTICQ
jgi:hypothetical protein